MIAVQCSSKFYILLFLTKSCLVDLLEKSLLKSGDFYEGRIVNISAKFNPLAAKGEKLDRNETYVSDLTCGTWRHACDVIAVVLWKRTSGFLCALRRKPGVTATLWQELTVNWTNVRARETSKTWKRRVIAVGGRCLT